MADADNIGRINIWRNSAVAADAATDAPEIEAFGRMTIYRVGRDARRHRHHEPHGGGGGGYTAVLNDDDDPVLNDDNAPVLVEV